MINDFLIWIGWSVDNTLWPPMLAQSFWSSPLGLFCTAALCVTSTIRASHWKSNSGFFDTVWHLCLALTTASAFFIGLLNQAPHHIVKTLIVLMTIRGILKCCHLHKKATKS